MEAEQIIIAPVITEKSVGQRALPRYVFKVHPDATKVAIKQAVQKIFKVNVRDVNICYVRGKARTAGKSRGCTSFWKKAYVRLAQGQKIQELEV